MYYRTVPGNDITGEPHAHRLPCGTLIVVPNADEHIRALLELPRADRDRAAKALVASLDAGVVDAEYPASITIAAHVGDRAELMVRIESDAFTQAAGYPPGTTIEGIPLRDRVWFEHALSSDRG